MALVIPQVTCNYLRVGTTSILGPAPSPLETRTDMSAQQIIEFLQGQVFTLQGSLQRVTAREQRLLTKNTELENDKGRLMEQVASLARSHEAMMKELDQLKQHDARVQVQQSSLTQELQWVKTVLSKLKRQKELLSHQLEVSKVQASVERSGLPFPCGDHCVRHNVYGLTAAGASRAQNP